MTIVYKTGEVMDRIGLKGSTFKKYLSLLEKEGYLIQKNASGHRLFTDEDITTFERFIEASRYDGMTLEAVARNVVQERAHVAVTEGHNGMTVTNEVMMLLSKALAAQKEQIVQHLDGVMTDMQGQLDAVTQQNKELIDLLKKQEENHDKILLKSLRDAQKSKQAMNLMKQMREEVAVAEQTKRQVWWQFWRK